VRQKDPFFPFNPVRAAAVLLLAVILTIGFCSGRASAAVINAINSPGAAGDIGTFSHIGGCRTQVGNDYTLLLAVYVDTLTPAAGDGYLWQCKRASNDATSHGVKFDDSGNRFCYVDNTVEAVCSTAISAATWYLVSLTYDEGTDTFTLWVHTLPAGAQVDSDTFTPTTSNYDDGDDAGTSRVPELTSSAYESGGTIFSPADVRMILHAKIDTVAMPGADLSDYAVDPLNVGDAWLVTYGANFRVWLDDTIACPGSVCTDVSGNSETFTLGGTMSLGAANGPDVPARSAPPPPAGTTTLIRRRME
jgi:hypothetical protein